MNLYYKQLHETLIVKTNAAAHYSQTNNTSSHPQMFFEILVLQDSTHLFQVMPWKFICLQPYVEWIKLKTYNPTNFLVHRTIYFAKLLKTNLLSETIISRAQPALICSNSIQNFEHIKICSKLRIEHQMSF